MSKLKFTFLIFCSFLFGGLTVFFLFQKQIRTEEKLIANLKAIQKLDDQRIVLDTDTFLKLFVCVAFANTCNTQEVLAEVEKSSLTVANLREKRQKLTNDSK